MRTSNTEDKRLGSLRHKKNNETGDYERDDNNYDQKDLPNLRDLKIGKNHLD
jgi:hypothetical protein